MAKEAVRSVAKGDGRAALKLNQHVEPPVSRSFYKALGDEEWWFDLGFVGMKADI